MPGDEEREALIADIGVIESLPALFIDAGEHKSQQVFCVSRMLSLFFTILDHVIDQVIHGLSIRFPLALLAKHEPVLYRETALSLLVLFQVVHHRLHKGIKCVAIKRVETIIKPAQANRIEGQAGHIGCHIDRCIGVEAFPFVHQLPSNVEHLGEVVLHGSQAKAGQQMLWALRQLGSWVYAVKSPSPTVSRTMSMTTPMALSKRLSSQSSSTNPKPETTVNRRYPWKSKLVDRALFAVPAP